MTTTDGFDVTAFRIAAPISSAIVAAFVLFAPCAQAQWWHRSPVDFEECADLAEKAVSKQEKTAALAECNAKFAGRRKPGGGYTYYDFLQDRTFDIAGPNPTAEEQKKIDAAYAGYLAQQGRLMQAEALARKQQEEIQQVSFRPESSPPREPERIPLPIQRPARPKPDMRTHAKEEACSPGTFACEWPRLSEALSGLKKIFNPPPPPSAKASKG